MNESPNFVYFFLRVLNKFDIISLLRCVLLTEKRQKIDNDWWRWRINYLGDIRCPCVHFQCNYRVKLYEVAKNKTKVEEMSTKVTYKYVSWCPFPLQGYNLKTFNDCFAFIFLFFLVSSVYLRQTVTYLPLFVLFSSPTSHSV